MQIIRQISTHNESSNFCSLDPTDIQLLSSSSVYVWHFCHHLTVDPHSLWAAQDGEPTMESCICGALTPSFLTPPPAPNLSPTMIHSLHSSLHDLFREICYIYIEARPILLSKPLLWLVLLPGKLLPLLTAVIPCSSFWPHWNHNADSSSLTQTQHMPHTHLKLPL